MADDRYLTVDLHTVYNEILTKAFSQEMSNLEPLSELKEIPKLLLALEKKIIMDSFIKCYFFVYLYLSLVLENNRYWIHKLVLD